VETSNIFVSKNNCQILLRRLLPGDIDMLCDYLNNLSPETKNRFGPHPYDKNSLIGLYMDTGNQLGFIALDAQNSSILAYSVIKIGYLEHDSPRLRSYGLILDPATDCTFAPSVADDWQSQGIGNALFHFALNQLKAKGINRIILWGGVQSDNMKAINYYRKNGFKELGQFEYFGMNTDMILEIS
jgi:diamine N-acetyltransferase